MTDDGDVLETGEPLLGLLESLRGDINNVDARGASRPLQRLGEHRELFPAAAPKLDDRRRLGVERGDDFVGVRDEQMALRARNAIPGQPANRFEQARPERIVQVFRLQLLRGQLQIASNVGGEFGEDCCCSHPGTRGARGTQFMITSPF